LVIFKQVLNLEGMHNISIIISDGADLKVQGNSGAGHQSVEMLTEFFREDVLRECLIGIKCLLLYTTDTYIDISNSNLMYFCG